MLYYNMKVGNFLKSMFKWFLSGIQLMTVFNFDNILIFLK